jgi:Na+-driven multidrug efflux pump
MGIILKLERVPINVSLGICLGMVPLIAYNYGSKNYKRMNTFSSLARWIILGFSSICMIGFLFLAKPLVGSFIEDPETVRLGVMFLRGRCIALPFMMIGYHTVNFMNAVNKGKVSFLLAIIRHIVLIIPVMLIMNAIWGLTGLVLSLPAADVINAAISLVIMAKVKRGITKS